MRHDTPAAVGRQSTGPLTFPRRVVAAALMTACLAGGVLAFTPARSAAQSRAIHATRLLADGCTSSSGPCVPRGW